MACRAGLAGSVASACYSLARTHGTGAGWLRSMSSAFTDTALNGGKTAAAARNRDPFPVSLEKAGAGGERMETSVTNQCRDRGDSTTVSKGIIYDDACVRQPDKVV